MKRHIAYVVFRITRWLVQLFYPRPTLEGLAHLPEGPCVIVGNHAQMNGPIVAELYIPGDRAIWCNAEMMRLREVPDYAFRDFWSQKPVCIRWFFRLLSYVIAPLSVCVFNNAHCIGVYRDARIMSTLRETLRRLKDGARIVIFPETDPKVSNILYSFQEHFIDLGRLYCHQTGERLAFVPMYVAPRLKKLIFGRPVYYDPEADPNAERGRIREELMKAITGIAEAQPMHRVVPYRRIPGEKDPYNTPDEVSNR